MTGLIGGAVLGLGAIKLTEPTSFKLTGEPSTLIGCDNPIVVDGDTLRCGTMRIRLAAIDAPEMPGHCRPGRQCTPGDPYASTANLRSMTAGKAIECRQIDTDRYGRAVANCSAEGHDLSCAQVEGGFAVERYGVLSC